MFRNRHLWHAGSLVAIISATTLLVAMGIPDVHARPLKTDHRSLAPSIIGSCPTSHVMPSPNSGSQGSRLVAVAPVSPSDVWAVGYNGDLSSSATTLIEHWDGTAWNVVSSPNTTAQRNVLQSVTAISSSDVWAVGYVGNTTSPIFQTLIEHWDGSKWSIVSSLNPGSYTDQLYGVAASSATDIWAVGMQGNNTTSGALIEHWNGTNWQVNAGPTSPPPLAQLQSVSVISSTDVWAVGNYETNTGHHTLAEHWNGTAWQVVSTPDGNTYGGGNYLYAVTSISTTSVWAVGAYADPLGASLLTLIEYWDGTNWTIVASPSVGKGDNQLNAVVAAGPNSVWAAGSYFDPVTDYILTLMEKWNGTSWSSICSASLGTYSQLSGLADVGGQVWAAGNWFNSSGVAETLVEVNLMFPMMSLSLQSSASPR